MTRSTPAIFLLLFSLSPATSFAATVTPAQRCEADVELASGKYAECRLKVESKYSKSLDADKRTAALARCSEKLEQSFEKAVARHGGACAATEPSSAFDAYLRRCSDDVAAAAAGGTLPDYVGDLSSCNADLTTCNGDFASCTDDLAMAEADLATCEGDLAACEVGTQFCGAGTVLDQQARKCVPETLLLSSENSPDGYSLAGSLGADGWASLPPMPTARFGLGAVAVNGTLYALGGRAANGLWLAHTEEYDPQTSLWTSRAPMPTARGWFASAAVNSGIFVIGGVDNSQQLDTVDRYDTTTDTWTARAPLPSARYKFSAATVGDKIYVVGGEGPLNLPNNVLEYDTTADAWTTKAPIPISVPGGHVAAEAGGKLYVIDASGAMFAYDPVVNTWVARAAMPTAHGGFAAAATVAGSIYVLGGQSPVAARVDKYDPAMNTWTICPVPSAMPTARGMHAAASINGKIYTVGGTTLTGSWPAFATAEEYLPALLFVHVRN